MDSINTLNFAETESRLWADAHAMNETRTVPQVEIMTLPAISGRWCFIHGSCFGQGWLSTLEGFDELLGARNVRACLSPLHTEIEALQWAIECMRNLP